MNKAVLIALIVAASLILIGALVGTAGLWLRGFSISGLFGNTVMTAEYADLADFRTISVEHAESDVRLVVSEDGTRRVVCREREHVPYTVAAENGTLTIRRNDQRKWYHHIGVFWERTEITVYLPEGEYDALTVTGSVCDVEIPKALSFDRVDISVSTGDVRLLAGVRETVSIETDTGSVEVGELTPNSVRVMTDTGSVVLRSVQATGEISVKTDTGRIELREIQCGSLTAKSSTGRQELSGVIASDKIDLTSDTGKVILTGCDAATLEITTSTGDVFASLTSEKIFMTKTSTGDVEVPDGTSGGICRITTSTGDIEANIQK